VNDLTRAGATLLMMAFSKTSPPVMSGVTATELKQRFGPKWTLKWAHPHQSEGTSAMTRAAAMWYCLTRE
jgi:hypothetical protein